MKKREKTKLTAILLVGFIIRLLSAWTTGFWFDEAISWSMAKQNIGSMLAATAADNHPPFYYLVLHFWLKLGQGEFFLRMPSIFSGTISILLIYLIGRQLFNRKVALTASLILAFSPLHVYFSAETRMYSLWTMFTLITVYYFLQILKKPTFGHYLLFTVYYLLSLYTHYFSLFSLLIFNLWLVTNRPKYQRWLTSWLFSQATIALLFLPWAFFFLRYPHPQPWSISPIIGIPATFLSFVLGGVGNVSLKVFFDPSVSFSIKFVFILVSLLFGFFFVLGLSHREKQREKRFLFFLISLPILLTALISFLYPVYFPRPFIAFSPYFYLLAAAGLAKLEKRFTVWPIALIALLLIFIVSVQNLYSFYRPPNLRAAARFIAQKDASPIVVHTNLLTFYPLTYYLPKEASQFLIFPSGLTRQTTDIIGGSPVSLAKVTSENKPFWSIHFNWDEKTWQFKKEQSKLESSYQYQLLKTIDRLEIYYYKPKIAN